MPDERRYLQTKPKKKICNPKFEERFVFQVSNCGKRKWNESQQRIYWGVTHKLHGEV